MKELIYKVEITLVATDTGIKASTIANFNLEPNFASDINKKIAQYICTGPNNKVLN